MANINAAVALESPALNKTEAFQLNLIHEALEGRVPAPLAFQHPTDDNREVWELHGMYEPNVIQVLRMEGWYVDGRASGPMVLVIWKPKKIKLI